MGTFLKSQKKTICLKHIGGIENRIEKHKWNHVYKQNYRAENLSYSFAVMIESGETTVFWIKLSTENS